MMQCWIEYIYTYIDVIGVGNVYLDNIAGKVQGTQRVGSKECPTHTGPIQFQSSLFNSLILSVYCTYSNCAVFVFLLKLKIKINTKLIT